MTNNNNSMNFHITIKSDNAKTGAMVVTTTDKRSCPDACPLKNNGCYANSGPLNLHWNKVTAGERGGDINYLVNAISGLPENQLGRFNQGGDLPGVNNKINGRMLRKLVKATKNKRFFTYTHKPVIGNKSYVKANRAHVKHANENGLTINLSANSLEHADELKALNIGPVAVVVPFKTENTFFTPQGNKGIVCPAQRPGAKVTCSTCQLCQKGSRNVIVGFIAHGTSKNRVNALVSK